MPKMLLPFRFFAGGRSCPARMVVSWIHRADLIGLIQWAMTTPTVCGPLNAVAPEAVTMKTFVRRSAECSIVLVAAGPELSLATGAGELGTLMTTGQRGPGEGGERAATPSGIRRWSRRYERLSAGSVGHDCLH